MESEPESAALTRHSTRGQRPGCVESESEGTALTRHSTRRQRPGCVESKSEVQRDTINSAKYQASEAKQKSRISVLSWIGDPTNLQGSSDAGGANARNE